MKDPKRVWVWVGVVVVVIVVLAWILWRLTPQQQIQSVPVTTFAPRGQLVPQFPSSLVLDPSAVVSGSYAINYSSSTNQYTAQYGSSDTVTALYKNYTSYLISNGWTISGSLTTIPTLDVISAAQGSNQLQVMIATKSKGSQVTITYVVE
jgi:hypothetical protein